MHNSCSFCNHYPASNHESNTISTNLISCGSEHQDFNKTTHPCVYQMPSESISSMHNKEEDANEENDDIEYLLKSIPNGQHTYRYKSGNQEVIELCTSQEEKVIRSQSDNFNQKNEDSMDTSSDSDDDLYALPILAPLRKSRTTPGLSSISHRMTIGDDKNTALKDASVLKSKTTFNFKDINRELSIQEEEICFDESRVKHTDKSNLHLSENELLPISKIYPSIKMVGDIWPKPYKMNCDDENKTNLFEGDNKNVDTKKISFEEDFHEKDEGEDVGEEGNMNIFSEGESNCSNNEIESSLRCWSVPPDIDYYGETNILIDSNFPLTSSCWSAPELEVNREKCDSSTSTSFGSTPATSIEIIPKYPNYNIIPQNFIRDQTKKMYSDDKETEILDDETDEYDDEEDDVPLTHITDNNFRRRYYMNPTSKTSSMPNSRSDSHLMRKLDEELGLYQPQPSYDNHAKQHQRPTNFHIPLNDSIRNNSTHDANNCKNLNIRKSLPYSQSSNLFMNRNDCKDMYNGDARMRNLKDYTYNKAVTEEYEDYEQDINYHLPHSLSNHNDFLAHSSVFHHSNGKELPRMTSSSFSGLEMFQYPLDQIDNYEVSSYNQNNIPLQPRKKSVIEEDNFPKNCPVTSSRIPLSNSFSNAHHYQQPTHFLDKVEEEERQLDRVSTFSNLPSHTFIGSMFDSNVVSGTMSDNVTPNGSTRLENTSSLRNSLSFSIKNGDGSNSFVINTPTIINGSPSPGLASSVQTTLVGGGGPVVSATEQAPSNNTTARKRVLPQRPDCINYKPMIPGQNQSYAATASCAKSDYKMEDELIYRRDFSQYISGSNVNHIPNPNGYDNIFQNNFNRFNHSTSQQFVSYGMGKQQQNNIVSSVPLADSNTQVTRSHRKLPPLPIKSEAAALLPNLGRPFLQSIPSLMNNQVHLNQQHSSNHSKNVNAPKSLDFDIHIENNLVHSPCYPYITRNQMNGKSVGDHQLCYGIESTMLRSACTIEDSYYEDGLNGNALGSVKQIIHSNAEDSSGVSSCCTNADSLNPTHRVQNIFIPRHDDEIVLEIGDAVHVEREYDDYWCYGTNLRTGKHGIFPVAHICEIDLVEEICMGALNNPTVKQIPEERDTFYLTMLASIEVAHHKGNDVLVQAINKVMSCYQNKEEILVPQTILMEVSLRGIHVIDKKKKNFFKCPTFDFFYSLQNISFCGAHPKHLKYFGFITKHPLLPRFACHVFLSNESTQPIVEAIGRAFKRSYDEYMAFAHPTEDIYIE